MSSRATCSSTRSGRACRASAAQTVAAAADAGLNLRQVDADTVGISFDETTTAATVAAVARVFGAQAPEAVAAAAGDYAFAGALVRESEYLTHPIFHSVRSETQMLRYLRRLADRDLALDRTMIPLGSCTMKLNSTAEMESDLLARVRRHPPVRSRRAEPGLARAHRPPRELAA